MSSIRTRVANRFVALLLTAVAVFGGTVYAARLAGVSRELERKGAERAEVLLQILGAAGSGNYMLSAERRNEPVGLLRTVLDAQPGYVVVFASTGERIYDSPRVRTLSAFLQGAEISELARADFESLEATVRSARADLQPREFQLRNDHGLMLGRRDATGRTVVVGVSRAEISVSWREILGSGVIILPLVVALAVMGSWMLAGSVLQPVDRIRQEVEAISDGRSLHRRVAVDLTQSDDELSRLTATLNAMIGRLETSFSGLRRFTADASHELKTPLAVLRADVERAMSAPPHSTEQLVALEEALQETARMTALVDSLLTLARADEGRFDLHREPVDLQELAREVFETALILGEPTEVQVSMEADLPAVVLGDRMRLRQLFMNLVENAIKYTPRGGSVELSLKVEEGLAAFAVKDSGIGIAAADLPHIFERFWRADRARTRMSERSGNGLGLAICQWIAQAHGGKLTVQSRLHRGSTFVASFPLAPTISMQAQAPTLAEEAATA